MTVIRVKRALAADWVAVNPILAQGEPGLELDTGRVKYGDGIRTWNNIPYVGKGVVTVTTATTLVPTETSEQFNVIAQVGPLAIAAPGTLSNLLDGQDIWFRIKDNGIPTAISWDSIYRPIGVTLPVITAANKTIYVGAKWNEEIMQYDVVAVNRET